MIGADERTDLAVVAAALVPAVSSSDAAHPAVARTSGTSSTSTIRLMPSGYPAQIRKNITALVRKARLSGPFAFERLSGGRQDTIAAGASTPGSFAASAARAWAMSSAISVRLAPATAPTMAVSSAARSAVAWKPR